MKLRYNSERLANLRPQLLVSFAVEKVLILAAGPDTSLCLALYIRQGSLSVLLSIFPLAVIFFAILPGHDSVAVLLVSLKRSSVGSPIGPFEYAIAVHLVPRPHAFVAATVVPRILAFSTDVVLHELSRVAGSIAPFEIAKSLLLAHYISALIFRTVWPLFHAI